MLPARHRMRLKNDFQKCYSEGIRVRCNSISIVAVAGQKILSVESDRLDTSEAGKTSEPSPLESFNTKVGFSISRKCGKAVVRNLLRRRLRAIMRELLPQFSAYNQIVITVKPNVDPPSYQALKADVLACLRTLNKRAGLS